MRAFVYYGTADPVDPPKDYGREYYNLTTDVLWSWIDASGPREAEDIRWMIGITNASQFDGELRALKLSGVPNILGVDIGVMTRVGAFDAISAD